MRVRANPNPQHFFLSTDYTDYLIKICVICGCFQKSLRDREILSRRNLYITRTALDNAHPSAELFDQRALVSQRRIVHIRVLVRLAQQFVLKALRRQSTSQRTATQRLHNLVVTDLLDRISDWRDEYRSPISFRSRDRATD